MQPARHGIFALSALQLRFVRRIGAFVLDHAVLVLAYLGIKWAVGRLVPTGSGGYDLLLGFSLAAVTWFNYTVIPTALRGATWGKRVFGLRVARPDGRRPGLGQVFLRESLGKWASASMFYVGFVWALWDYKGQAWHDMMSETLVQDGP